MNSIKVLTIKVKLKSKKQEVVKINDTSYLIKINQPPEKGKANKKMIELLADYFKISKSRIFIKSGFTSRRKTVVVQFSK